MNIEVPLASGLTSGVTGLQIGIVKKLDADPGGQHKIQITVPVMQATADGVWARLASFYGFSEVVVFLYQKLEMK